MRFTTPDHQAVDITIDTLLVAGWTGRDRAAVDHHIQELAAIGVPPPSTVPLYYRVAANQLYTGTSLQVVGEQTSGEVEPVILANHDGLWLGLGSDHTDRGLEAHSVALAKQICAKPMATQLWPYAEVAKHLDELQLRSWISDDGHDWQPYQEGTLAAIRPLEELIRNAPGASPSGLAPATAMFCGTLGVQGGVRPALGFRMSLTDPLLGREIHHEYRVRVLPTVV